MSSHWSKCWGLAWDRLHTSSSTRPSSHPNERAPATYGGPPPALGPPPGLPPLTSMHAPSSTGVMPPPPQQPCLDLSGEIWVETKNPQGKAYYYNARTRESAWNKPEGPGIKVLSQEQIESMAAAAGVAPGGGLVTNAVPVFYHFANCDKLGQIVLAATSCYISSKFGEPVPNLHQRVLSDF
ncbi:hypothetical protein HPB51_028626 [Rhipicephalus microplus]|uniref:WW domain-containing protein n=1 Tax=Rhipicephalus microplus TaxID=6941 RepID=A0A9J6CWI8_RHIMP|nr:hypothetical protein HPB51_028626 [Rhipicephalus microplus]